MTAPLDEWPAQRAAGPRTEVCPGFVYSFMNASASEGHWRESPKLFIYAVRITNILTCGSNRPSAEEVVRFSRQTVV